MLAFLSLSLSLSSFEDPGPHGTGRHMDHMLPEIPKIDFRKGAQVNLIPELWNVLFGYEMLIICIGMMFCKSGFCPLGAVVHNEASTRFDSDG